MTAALSPRHRHRCVKRVPRLWRAALIAGVFFVIALSTWVGVRGFLAKGEMDAAVPLSIDLKEQILAQDSKAAKSTALALDGHVQKAATLTSDAGWRLVEFVPLVGPNLTAFRELVAVVDALSDDAVGPLAELALSVDGTAFRPVDGQVNLQPIIEARPVVQRAADALERAERSMAAVNTAVTVPAIRGAHEAISNQLSAVAGPVRAIRTATMLVPDMLGGSEPRDFLLLVQNPAELRATGGISGAMALLRADKGRIALVQQASSGDFPRFEEPVLSLDKDTRSLYNDITGQYIQNVNLTPRFPLTAEISRQMWKERFGTDVSGVLSIDPVALSYLLDATGPIELPTGDVLSAENAVTLLLRDVYVRYDAPAQQDVFFAAAASAVFERVANGNLEPSKLIDALAKSGAERRISVWSSVELEQQELQSTTLAGTLPEKTQEGQPFGVYLNDATASKMDFYLDVQIAAAQVTCRRDGRPNFGLIVTLRNTAPLDAASTFPDYVTGGGSFGVTPGNIKTLVNVYGTPELQNLGVVRDGQAVPYLPATDLGYQVSQVAVELAPGEEATLHFGFLGDAPFAGDIVIRQTPVINLHETKKLALSCESPLW